MIENIIEWDKALMLDINHAVTPFWDVVMQAASYKFSVIPFCILILFLLFYKNNPKRAIVMAAAIVVTFALCDSLSTHLIKHNIERFRPCYDPSIESMVRMLEYKGGKFGFVSSHATNLFGLALVSSYAIRKKWFAILMFGWATLVSYSRVYVGKHFPLDVICGALFGLIIAFLVLMGVKYLFNKYPDKFSTNS